MLKNDYSVSIICLVFRRNIWFENGRRKVKHRDHKDKNVVRVIAILNERRSAGNMSAERFT